MWAYDTEGHMFLAPKVGRESKNADWYSICGKQREMDVYGR